MNYITAIIFGIIQGLTEFLPVSSSGHLVILHRIAVLPIKNEAAFDLALHFATLIALLIFFKKEILLLIISWLKSFSGEKSEDGKLSWMILIAALPAALAGFFFADYIENNLRSPVIVAAMLIIVGVLFIIVEKWSDKNKNETELSAKNALIIGLAQSLAFVPGVSRSGITIIAGMRAGLKREEAVKFSFLLSIPAILGASLVKLPQLFFSKFQGDDIMIIALAFIAAFIAGFLAIKYFLLLARKYSLAVFAFYRFILASIIILLMFVK